MPKGLRVSHTVSSAPNFWGGCWNKQGHDALTRPHLCLSGWSLPLASRLHAPMRLTMVLPDLTAITGADIWAREEPLYGLTHIYFC